MKTRNFHFDLPPEQIAQYPSDRRENARLFVLNRDTGTRHHTTVADLPRFVGPGTLLVRNDTRVRKARVEGVRSDTGGRVELLFLARRGPRRWQVLTSRTRRQRPGVVYGLPGGLSAEIVAEEGEERVIELSHAIDERYFEAHGAVPLPPYIRRRSDSVDEHRYQTVFARDPGSVAAPTAGLHFTQELFGRLEDRGVTVATITLHVGLGTFRPVRTEEVEQHEMHEEAFTIPGDAARAVTEAVGDGREILAVGTTSVRALEAAARAGSESAAPPEADREGEQAGGLHGEREGLVVAPGTHTTRLFIYPGFDFRIVTSMFTNFHTPQSSLLMLVCAFAGTERVLDAYREAVAEGYRFFSYGDAMLIH